MFNRSWAIALGITFAATIAGCEAFMDRSPREYTDDARITVAVKNRLANEGGRSFSRVAVDTESGTVHLSGTVRDDGLRQRAGELARDVRGVRRVVNQVEIAGTRVGDPRDPRDPPDDRGLSDATITSKVKIELAKQRVPGDIGVTTRERVVTLTGSVPDARASERAKRATRQVVGVERVINTLRTRAGDAPNQPRGGVSH